MSVTCLFDTKRSHHAQYKRLLISALSFPPSQSLHLDPSGCLFSPQSPSLTSNWITWSSLPKGSGTKLICSLFYSPQVPAAKRPRQHGKSHKQIEIKLPSDADAIECPFQPCIYLSVLVINFFRDRIFIPVTTLALCPINKPPKTIKHNLQRITFFIS